MEIIAEEKCRDCGKEIVSGEGRYRYASETFCESCGDSKQSIGFYL